MRLRVLHLRCLLTAMQVEALLLRCLYGRVDQIANNLVAVGRNADGLTAAHKLADHLRARIGLAGTGRPLDREDAPAQAAAEPDSRLHRGFARAVKRLSSRPRDF